MANYSSTQASGHEKDTPSGRLQEGHLPNGTTSCFKDGPILIVTATKIETDALHASMTPRHGNNCVNQVDQDAYTFHLGRLGGVNVVHVQCVMGSGTSGGSTITVSHAIGIWKPCAIIMVGIAFGVDDTKQKIADVLVSRRIIPYEQQKVGETANEDRSIPLMAGPILINRFNNALTWCQDFGAGGNCKVIHGDLLSGEKLIDNREYRDSLVKDYGPVVGGEMEGCGLMVAARACGVPEWIVVKGICDFADGFKGIEKDARQRNAAMAAVSLCEHVIANNRCFHTNSVTTDSPPIQLNASLNDIFFLSYKRAVEQYFLSRTFDQKASTVLKYGNLWLWGKSGVGKTVALQRTASQLGLECVYVDLSSAVNVTVCSLLEDAFWRLAAFFNADTHAPPNGTQKDSDYWVRAIVSLIADKLRGDTVIIFDEFSLRSQGDFEPFLNYALTIILRLTNQTLPHRLHLAFASASQPLTSTDPLFKKFQERFTMLEMDEWTKDEIQSLAKLISHYTNISPALDELDSLNIKNPRSLKTLLRLHLLDTTTEPNLTLLETVQKHRDELF